MVNFKTAEANYVPMDTRIYKTVTFYCPKCKEMLSPMYHMTYECGCGKQWLSPEPVSNDGTRPIRDM